MKTYKVLETHIGDDPYNPYVPGDEKYGTRTMSATVAKALLDLGLLGEIEEEAPVEAAVDNPAEKPAEKQVEQPAAEQPEAEAAEPPAPVTSRKSATKGH
ncbi:putative membrane protein [Novosphingobium chloroacetimidivorans]|uniref:Putative membrane protein n=1 Tax=Novosphingobium chloroacetimidivorans TaxID=1428314 RepID=A0A7W7K8P9_9SPHN|nr:hypothetical protein [Novosphingobium chloroacetimidivorans]MBB4858266.1 putative membrane protein [Novosphingobium chloroacetimidivorans]